MWIQDILDRFVGFANLFRPLGFGKEHVGLTDADVGLGVG